MTRSSLAILAPLLVLIACGGADDQSSDSPGRGAAERDSSSLWFVDATQESGLGLFLQMNGAADKPFIDESFGAGVALVDVEGDGDLDVYFCNGGLPEGEGGETPRDALFLNDGSGRFTDGTAAAGLGSTDWNYGVCAADHDGDGDVDLYLTARGVNRLLSNRGDGTFEDVTERAGVGDPRWSTGAAFLDFDRDGDLDLYVANHIDLDRRELESSGQVGDFFDLEVYFGPAGLAAQGDAFYVNQGDGTFREATDEVGIGGVELFGFQVVALDYDNDGWNDIYVANDSTPNLLWRNKGDGTFEDVGYRVGVALSMNGDPQAGMGVAVGDYDGDAIADLYVTNFSEDYFTLYRGSGQGLFTDTTRRAGLYNQTLDSLGWGTGFEDFDGDGDLDLYVVNGHVFPQVDQLGRRVRYLQRNQVFENGGDGRFRVPSGEGGPGFAILAASRGSAAGDLDGDGDVDLVVGNLDGPPTVIRNDGAQGRTVRVRLVGAGSNPDALGARVEALAGDLSLLRIVGASHGFLSTGDLTLHFGLGEARGVDSLEIRWPDGSEERTGPLEAGSVWTVRQGEGISGSTPFVQADGGGR